MIRMTISSLLTALLIFPFTAAAHQGHGHGAGNELWHYLGSPAHILPAAIVLAVTVGILLFRQNRQTAAGEEEVRNPK
jgi:hypothetical protein